MSTFEEIFGKRLREQRKAAGFMQQAGFADKAGVSVSAISAYEKGVRMPDARVLPKLAEAAGCTVDYLVQLDDAARRENANIAKETGLSEKAIDALRGFTRNAQRPTDAASAIRMVAGQAGYYANVLASLNAIIENENVLAALSNYLCVGGFPSGDYTINDKYELVRNRETTGNGGFIAFETREVVEGTMLLQSYYFDKIKSSLSMLRNEMQEEDE